MDGLKSAKDWIKEPILNNKTTKVKKPPLSNAITVKPGKSSNTSIFENALGCYLNVGNDVYNSAIKVALFTSCDSSNANGISVTPENYDRIMTIFTARKLIESTWINNKDNYLQPDETNSKWEEFKTDSYIYSLFHSASNQSSLHNLAYDNKTWNIKNEFFFMSKQEIMDLADKHGYDFTYNDARVSEERFVYKKLQNISLSNEAKSVLDKAKELTIKTFEYREMFNQQYPEYQIMNWDCGWYQIKGLLKEYFADDLADFNDLFKQLSDKMRPCVYELGFLK